MGGSIRVLHVDDEPDFADLTRTFLEREDGRFDVEVATSVSEARERLAEGDVDCVVSDYDMPEQNGVAFLGAVREDHPDLPFVLFTGKGSEEVASEAISAGVTDYLQKGTATEQYELLAHRIGNAVEQRRTARRAATFDRVRGLVADITQALVRAESREEIERRACEIISDADQYRFAVIAEVDPETRRVEPRAWSGIEEGYLEEITVTTDETPTGQGPGGRAVREDRVVVSQNVQEDPAFEPWREAALERGFRAVAAVPLRSDDEVFGLLVVYADRPGAFDDTERDLLAELGDNISHALHSRRTRTQLQRHKGNLERLHQAANRLYAAESVEACYEITIDVAVTILGFDWCTLAAPAEGTDEFEIVAISPEAPLEVGDRPFGLDEGLAGRVYQTKEPSIVADAQDFPRAEPTAEALRSALTVPVGDWGIFQAVTTTTDAFGDQDRNHAELLVASMLTAVERIEQQAELEDRRRELERQNDRLDEFASVVSHDLRNPLNVASARLELAREEHDSPQLEGVDRAHERMARLIEDLLTLAREGRPVEEVQAVDLAEAVEQYWRHVPTDDATLAVETDRTVRADPDRLAQLLENLFRNAVEHGSTSPPSSSTHEDAVDHGGASVTVTVGSLADGFFVADDGPGIPADERSAVFESGYSTADGGTGFGLAIVAEIVEGHGWEIGATESEAGGARFEITGVEFV